MYFDLEMQREKSPGYPLPKRGIYYCSRMISRQLTSLKDEDYGKIKPVYSVWIIVNNIPQVLQYSKHEFALSGTNSQADLIHLCLIFLAEDFKQPGGAEDELLRYLQSVFIKKAGDPELNPYAEYSKGIAKEADEIMTIVGMFEERAEKRGEERLKTLFRCLKQQGRENDIDQIISSDNTQMLEKLYAEFHLLHNNDGMDERNL